jgi:hypothetical protein
MVFGLTRLRADRIDFYRNLWRRVGSRKELDRSPLRITQMHKADGLGCRCNIVRKRAGT